jgi:hypothetical protein
MPRSVGHSGGEGPQADGSHGGYSDQQLSQHSEVEKPLGLITEVLCRRRGGAKIYIYPR